MVDLSGRANAVVGFLSHVLRNFIEDAVAVVAAFAEGWYS